MESEKKKRNLFSVTLDDFTAEKVRDISYKINQDNYKKFGFVAERNLSSILRKLVDIGIEKMKQDGFFKDDE